MDTPESKKSEPQPVTTNRDTSIRGLLRELYAAIIDWFRAFLNLEEGADREGTIIYIKNSKRMRGASAWLLICSIMLASLGLDLNSPAVIIGAMLISPLMAPILGVGLAVGINDRETLIISLQHFAISIFIALATSFLYFTVTPLGDLTDEIRARTSPTLLDSLIAIFGGLAGIISTSRKETSNAIPGVAIATALMPPLCVTGFGLTRGFETGNWTIAINSFYLFFLNSFFIALTAFLIIRLLRFPMRSYMDRREALRARWIVGIVSLILVLPSGRILFELLQQRNTDQKIQSFVEFFFNGNNYQTRCIDYTFLRGDSTNQLVLQLIGKDVNPDSMFVFYQFLDSVGLPDTEINILQDQDIGMETLRDMQLEIQNLGQVSQELENANRIRSVQARELSTLRGRIDSSRADSILFVALSREARANYPDLEKISYGKVTESAYQDSLQQLPVFLIHWKTGKPAWQQAVDERRLKDWLKVRAQLDTFTLVRY